MPTALVIMYWLWTGISLVVLTGRGVRRLRARRERRRAWQSLGSLPSTPAEPVAAGVLDEAGDAPLVSELDAAPPTELPVPAATEVPGAAEVAAAPVPAATRAVPDGPPQATRAGARPRPLDDVLAASSTAGVAEVLVGVRLPDDFVPVIDDVVAAAGGRCLRFDTARTLSTTRADLVDALTAAGIETIGDGADELVARRGDGAVRITLAQAPPTPGRPLPAVRVELATLS